MAFELILTETNENILQITLNRPKALNALNRQLAEEIILVLRDADKDPTIGCIIITGSEKAFAAGADIKEMHEHTFSEMYDLDWFSEWDQISQIRTPIIAAVSGYALGGGCELALMCDFILASETAKFGQPEISLGIMPGIGGTQRLTRIIGKSKAMEMCLTGRFMDAHEAEKAGLVSRITAPENLLEEAKQTAKKIATFSKPIVQMAKESVNRSYETSLSEGVRFERRLFHAMFSTADQKEGMSSFIEKREAIFNDK
ncbi:enoyl-CoA hydratase [Alphaproteobacteria bacterium]|nr:enoyl-CoA hydratase [Alphaproteobacteria bacterium]